MNIYISNNDERVKNYLAIPLKTLGEWLEGDEYLQSYLIYDEELSLDTLGMINQDEGGIWFESYSEKELFYNYCSFNIE